jgi:hypothetical protein
VWLGFCRVEVPPSPKSQEYVGLPVQFEGVALEVKLTLRGAAPPTGVADAVQAREQAGTEDTVIFPVSVQVTPLTVAFMDQPYVPSAVYVCEGFCSVEFPPSPKVQA